MSKQTAAIEIPEAFGPSVTKTEPNPDFTDAVSDDPTNWLLGSNEIYTCISVTS